MTQYIFREAKAVSGKVARENEADILYAVFNTLFRKSSRPLSVNIINKISWTLHNWFSVLKFIKVFLYFNCRL
jgi:hypothetical protein